MPDINYVAQGLDGEQIEAALEAIDGVVTQENNGKVLAIENGKIVAKSASEWTDAPVLEPLSVTANGDYTPGAGVDGFNSVHVAVPGAGNIQPLSVTENGTYDPPSGVDGYAPVTVNVSGGGGLHLGLDTLINNQVFLSTRTGDIMCSYSTYYSDGNRNFRRTSNEPLIIIQMTTTATEAYVGYGVIYFTDAIPAGVAGSYGELTKVESRQYTTPKGTGFNVARMSGMWQKTTSRMQVTLNNNSSSNLRSYFQFGADTAVTFLYGASVETQNAFANATQSQIDEIYALIDYVYETYYAS